MNCVNIVGFAWAIFLRNVKRMNTSIHYTMTVYFAEVSTFFSKKLYNARFCHQLINKMRLYTQLSIIN